MGVMILLGFRRKNGMSFFVEIYLQERQKLSGEILSLYI